MGKVQLRGSLKRVLFYSGSVELSRTLYDTDLTDTEWEQLAPLVPAAKPGGRPPKHSRREILNAIFYAVRGGCAWKLLPHDLPPWRTVYHYFWSWRRTGVWQQIHDRLREQVREAAGRNTNPSAAILDSQSIRTSEAGGVRGYDGGKQIRGRKRHILVDTLGLLLLVVVTAANVQDRNGAQILLSPLATQFRRLRLIWADGAYAGELTSWTRGLRKWGKLRLEIVRKPKGQKGFSVLPWRWRVERTFAWLCRNRRLRCDYERLPQTTEAIIYVAMIRLMTRRLAAS
jgi:putative transposase